MFNGRDYSPTELLDVCLVQGYIKFDEVVRDILAVVVAERDPTALKKALVQIIGNLNRGSIGQGLDHLISVSTIGNELKGGLDGVDALTYHLSGHQCQEGIIALQKVLDRFKEEEKPIKKPVCELCGETDLQLLEYGPDPYMSDVEGTKVNKWLCRDCHQSLCDDI